MYGLYMGWLDASEEWSTGLDREIVKSEMNMMKHVPSQYGVMYSDTLILDFCIFHQDRSPFSYVESRHINNWLTQDSYKVFKVNDDNIDNVYYKVICTGIQDITLEGFCGKRITMTCDSSFGYMREVVKKVDLTSGSGKCRINNTSDDGIYRPQIIIECADDYEDDIEFVNNTDDNTMNVKMVDIPIVNNKKTLNIDTQRMMVTDGENKLVPLYKLGWTITPDNRQAIPSSSELYWLRFVQGINDIDINGYGKVTFKMSFPRKAGQLNEY